MFLKPGKPRSIASQLVMLFTPAAALLLCCGLAVFYVMVVRHAFAEDNVFLADKIFALRADLKKLDSPRSLHEQLTSDRAGDRNPYWVRVLDGQGETVAETPGMTPLMPAELFPAPLPGPSFAQSGQNYRTGGKLFSLVATREEKGEQAYTIQVAQDRSEDQEFARTFGILLIVVLAGGIVASGLIAITVTKRGLQPLARMTESLQRIGPTHLNERVAPAGWPRELQPLAAAFDGMLDRLEESFTRLSQFSADIAHELRTPVANVLGEAQVILTRARTPEEYREVIESSVGECERLSGIIDNLLFLARSEAQREQTQRTLFNGAAAVEKIVRFYETIAEEQNIKLTFTGQAEIDADPMLFSRAVSNLVDNALRFTPPGGSVHVGLSSEAKGTAISVTDTGPGIAAQHLPRIFDRFYRVDSSRSSQGTGLGLALVKSIVDLHGGSAAVASEVNRGTTVTLTFPRR